MTLSEILNEIHNKNMEVEVYKALSEWIVLDRQQKKVEVARCKSTIKAISKIANNNPNKKEALNGIRNLCVCEDGQIILLDDCGNIAYCDMKRFKVEKER